MCGTCFTCCLFVCLFVCFVTQSKEKAAQHQRQAVEEQDDNLTEISNNIHGDLLSENPEVSQSAFGPPQGGARPLEGNESRPGPTDQGNTGGSEEGKGGIIYLLLLCCCVVCTHVQAHVLHTHKYRCAHTHTHTHHIARCPLAIFGAFL